MIYTGWDRVPSKAERERAAKIVAEVKETLKGAHGARLLP
jgi:hypothetical protein